VAYDVRAEGLLAFAGNAELGGLDEAADDRAGVRGR
jgi:hypothetical protein